MRQLASIAWKEWHEARIFLWIALGVFIGLPIAGGPEELYSAPMRHFQILPSPWVVTLGGVLSVFIAIGASCRDFAGHLEDFWRSRPVGIVRWLLIKYAIGLLVVLAGCLLPLFLEYWIDSGRESDATTFLLLPFQWIAIYSLAFLGGCLVRRAAHAAMLGLAAMLLVYFLPLVLPPLSWLNFAEVSNVIYPWAHDSLTAILRHTPLAQFAAAMLAVAIAALLAATIAVQRDWHIDSGRKMMYGAVVAALLILFSSAAFQLGTNLPILQKVDLPNDEHIMQFELNGAHGFIISERDVQAGSPSEKRYFTRRSVDVTRDGVQTGAAVATGWIGRDPSADGTQENPGIKYQFGSGPFATAATDYHYYLSVSYEGKLVTTQQLPWQYDPDDRTSSSPRMYAWNKRLYAFGARLLTLDISDPRAPRMIGDVPFDYGSQDWNWEFNEPTSSPDIPPGRQNVEVPLPDVPPPQRLRAALFYGYAFDGEILCAVVDGGICEYRLTDLTDTQATFKQIARRDTTMLERLFGFYGNWDTQISDGLLYVQQANNGRGLDPLLTVFDTRGATPLRLIGHFAARGGDWVRPLPDGRALIAGTGKLWLVGPPPHSGQN